MEFKAKRSKLEALWSQLDTERSSFIPHWRDIADHTFPTRGRWSLEERNRGDRKTQKILDGTARLAARTLRSGMMGGITSPARKWFKLRTPYPDLNQFYSVKSWLAIVEDRMNLEFYRSNVYNVLPIIYGDMGIFGTGCMFMEEDLETTARFYPFPIGSYVLANDSRLKVGVFGREFMMTVRQIMEKFALPDKSNLSDRIKDAAKNGRLEEWIAIRHMVAPNEDYDGYKIDRRSKKFSSCYYEIGTNNSERYLKDGEDDKVLRESGYEDFPVLAPRWEITGEDVYGNSCPGIDSHPDNKQLQHMTRRGTEAMDKVVRPPMVAPPSMKNMKASILPGDITYSNDMQGGQGFRPAFQVEPRIRELSEEKETIRQRISRFYFEDLFLMLSQSDRREITAREIEERHEEKLVALGPVLEQLNQDLLDPMVSRMFKYMLKQGKIPPPPEELRGVEIGVEYISVMAQAQKLIGIGGTERFAQFAIQIGTVAPSALDVVDTDELLREHAELTSVNPKIIRSPEVSAKIREDKLQMEKAKLQAESLKDTSTAVRNFSESDTEGSGALAKLLQVGQAGALTPP